MSHPRGREASMRWDVSSFRVAPSVVQHVHEQGDTGDTVEDRLQVLCVTITVGHHMYQPQPCYIHAQNHTQFKHLRIHINEHKNTNMFIFIIIYFTNVFEDNHIFLYRCLHRNLVTSRTINEKITNSNSCNKNNACFYIFNKDEEPQ